ncbi:acyl-CoA dehydrogenase [Amycolatopsis rhizosphaerae]|uniref:Acyl-CoA dehydrogenase n=1 Tax=Amycolatopsis rhizosphaerae TaxID=2053003 RepID=A0A558DJZ7_9PSEU|nr:acyl-CoA dehydrogenase family protein [Amycolatopsis rhizosphaerae]TVT61338.1 acyl-CoA dehydrogenase [Amycolatopsis rhizosphaerae]
MRFALSQEQTDFAASMDHLLSDLDMTAVIRAWTVGEHEPGRKVWHALAELGVTALVIPERFGGLAATAVDLVVAFERLGYHTVPGPWVETVAVLPALFEDESLEGVAAGEKLVSIANPPHVPYALDADIADLCVYVAGTDLRAGTPTSALSSVDGARRLFAVEPGERLGVADDPGRAFDLGALATAAQLLGAGQRLLDTSVAYAKQRRQYGRAIGQYQSIKHLLADVATKLELARPLLYAAAVATGSPVRTRDVSAAKVAAGEAASLAARTGLQVHGAIGYTAEHSLGLSLTKVRALVGAWGTPAFHRRRILEALV